MVFPFYKVLSSKRRSTLAFTLAFLSRLRKQAADDFLECLPQTVLPHVKFVDFFKAVVVCRAYLEKPLSGNEDVDLQKLVNGVSSTNRSDGVYREKDSMEAQLAIALKKGKVISVMKAFDTVGVSLSSISESPMDDYPAWTNIDTFVFLLMDRFSVSECTDIFVKMVSLGPDDLKDFVSDFNTLNRTGFFSKDDTVFYKQVLKSLEIYKILSVVRKRPFIPKVFLDYLECNASGVLRSMLSYDIGARTGIQLEQDQIYGRAVKLLGQGFLGEGSPKAAHISPRRAGIRGFIRELLSISSVHIRGILEVCLEEGESLDAELDKLFGVLEDAFMGVLIVDDVVDWTGIPQIVTHFHGLLMNESSLPSSKLELGEFSALYDHCRDLCQRFRRYFKTLLSPELKTNFDRDLAEVLSKLQKTNLRCMDINKVGISKEIDLEEYLKIPIVELVDVFFRYFVLGVLYKRSGDDQSLCLRIFENIRDGLISVAQVCDVVFNGISNMATDFREMANGDPSSAPVVAAHKAGYRLGNVLDQVRFRSTGFSLRQIETEKLRFGMLEKVCRSPETVYELIVLIQQLNGEIFKVFHQMYTAFVKGRYGPEFQDEVSHLAFQDFVTFVRGILSGDREVSGFNKDFGERYGVSVMQKMKYIDDLLEFIEQVFLETGVESEIYTLIELKIGELKVQLASIVESLKTDIKDTTKQEKLNAAMDDYINGFLRVFWIYMVSKYQPQKVF